MHINVKFKVFGSPNSHISSIDIVRRLSKAFISNPSYK